VGRNFAAKDISSVSSLSALIEKVVLTSLCLHRLVCPLHGNVSGEYTVVGQSQTLNMAIPRTANAASTAISKKIQIVAHT
jgi:hypothetical protein